MAGGLHDRGHAWQGVCMTGGMHGRGVCMTGGMRAVINQTLVKVQIKCSFRY